MASDTCSTGQTRRMPRDPGSRTGGVHPSLGIVAVFSCLFAFGLMPGLGQESSILQDEAGPVSLRVFLGSDAVAQGGTTGICVVADIAKGYHINSHNPTLDFLIPTEVTFKLPEGFKASQVAYPLALMRSTEYAEEELAVYEEEVRFIASVSAARDLAPGTYQASAELFYQSCDEASCFPPEAISAEVAIRVVSAGTPVTKLNQQWFERPSREQDGGEIARTFQEKGLVITFLLFFLGGLALNLTPCVFPVIPITIGFFMNQSGGKMSRTFLLGACYLLGLAVTYSALGVTAALSGGLFGAALQNPIVLALVALVLVGLAFSMFGLYEIPLPMFLSGAGASKQGLVGALMMGLVVGVIAAPCIGPFVLSLLIFVAAKGDAVFGFLSFFILALGLGLPLVLLGTFSGATSKLPRSGIWMEWIRRFFGCAILVLAVHFISPLLPGKAATILIGLGIVVSAVYLGFIEKAGSQLPRFKVFKKVFAVAVLACVLGLAARTMIVGEVEGIAFKPYSQAAVERARKEGKPVMIDFWATWCIPCKELERVSFTHKEVVSESERFVLLKADLTKESSEASIDLMKRYQIRGVPTVVFLDGSGKEAKNSRINKFISGEELLRVMRGVK